MVQSRVLPPLVDAFRRVRRPMSGNASGKKLRDEAWGRGTKLGDRSNIGALGQVRYPRDRSNIGIHADHAEAIGRAMNEIGKVVPNAASYVAESSLSDLSPSRRNAYRNGTRSFYYTFMFWYAERAQRNGLRAALAYPRRWS
jgi:hypothetical protein